ncbi:MAG: DUF4430 domain-containing protein [Firmicutes bacterium]|nr:DUF4430 domain-containing protein [Bacillota bacterium]
MKSNRKKIIAGLVILAVLAVAFWYGGNAPGLRGWNVGKAEEPAETVAEVPEPVEGVEATEEEPDPEEQPAEDPVETVAEPVEATQGEPDETPQESEEQPAGETVTVVVEPEEAKPEEPAPADETTPGIGPSAMDIDPATGKDKYLTDPVPEGKPAPVEPQDVTVTDVAHTCTISIECKTILDHMDWLDPEKVELVPEDGIILAPVTVTFYEGESVFNVLQRTCRQNGIHMEFENTPMYNSAYIEGIHNLYEFDCGELSGWMYSVNGWFPNYGCSRYALQAGDVIRWVYTCDLGYDVGGGYAVGE